MSTMTKKAIIEDLHDRLNGEVRKNQIEAVYEQLIDQIITTVKAGDTYRFGDLGTFREGTTAAREGVSPQNGEKINIPARKRISFKIGNAAKRTLNDE